MWNVFGRYFTLRTWLVGAVCLPLLQGCFLAFWEAQDKRVPGQKESFVVSSPADGYTFSFNIPFEVKCVSSKVLYAQLDETRISRLLCADGLYKASIEVSANDGPHTLKVWQDGFTVKNISLKRELCSSAEAMASNDFTGGQGSVEDPFVICSPAQLDLVRSRRSISGDRVYFRLGKSIDLSEDAEYSSQFLPLNCAGSGCLPADPEFRDDFDGFGFSIGELRQTLAAPATTGLFGALGASAFIHRLNLANAYVSYAGTNAGIVAASMNGGKVDAVSVSGHVDAQDTAGGLLGLINDGTIQNSFSNANVSTTQAWSTSAGGIAGKITSGDILNSVYKSTSGDATLDVYTSQACAGGVVGKIDRALDAKDVHLTRVRAYGDINASSSVGGLVGCASSVDSDHVFISESQSVASVTAGYANGGGLVGTLSRASINKCYTGGSVEVAGWENGGGLVGSAVALKVSDSYTNVDVISSRTAAAMVGDLSEGEITRSYSTGAVVSTVSNDGANATSGFIGSIVGGAVTLKSVFTFSELTTSFDAIEGYLLGKISSGTLDIEDAHYTNSTYGCVGAVISGSVTQVGCNRDYTMESYYRSDSPVYGSDWDFTNVWAFNGQEGSRPPVLKWQVDLNLVPSYLAGGSDSTGGGGTGDNPDGDVGGSVAGSDSGTGTGTGTGTGGGGILSGDTCDIIVVTGGLGLTLGSACN